jgi:hypothetical protein
MVPTEPAVESPAEVLGRELGAWVEAERAGYPMPAVESPAEVVGQEQETSVEAEGTGYSIVAVDRG